MFLRPPHWLEAAFRIEQLRIMALALDRSAAGAMGLWGSTQAAESRALQQVWAAAADQHQESAMS